MEDRKDINIIDYAVNQYNETFDLDYKPNFKTKEEIEKLLKIYPYSTMVEWHYCCYGLYQNCWQDLTEEGNWGLTQEQVNQDILDVFTDDIIEVCKNENRMFSCKKNGRIELLIVARDLEDHTSDYLISFNRFNS